jgi:hypothetical protein
MTRMGKIARMSLAATGAAAALGVALLVSQCRRASSTPWGRVVTIQRADERSVRVVLDITDVRASDECPPAPISVGQASAAQWEYYVANSAVEELTARRVVLRIRTDRAYTTQSPPGEPETPELLVPSTWTRVCFGPWRVGTPVELCCVRYKRLWGDRFRPTEVYYTATSPALPPDVGK